MLGFLGYPPKVTAQTVEWQDQTGLPALNGTNATPSSAHVASSNFSTSRVHSEYSDCTAVIWCTACARRNVSLLTSDRPRARTLPAFTFGSALALPLVAVILLAALVGAPVFVAMGGIALVLFFKDSVPVSAVTADIYRLMVSPTLPAVPLLTACGYVMAESQASHRLVRFFRALFGWMPGGVAVLVAAVCALFTTFTGGSGVTIMALGGLLLPVLLKDGYAEGFSLGLVTASGSLGLLLPPSLPVILYAVVANVPADQLYLAEIGRAHV